MPIHKKILSGIKTVIANPITALVAIVNPLALGSLALKIITDIFAPDVDTPDITPTRNPAQAIPIIYGRAYITGSNLVFMRTQPGGPDQLHTVHVICEGEIDAIERVIINGTNSTDGKYVGQVEEYKYVGTSTQTVETNLSNAFAEVDSNFRLQGLAYVAHQFNYKPKAGLTGLPQLSFVIRGKHVFDPRDSVVKYSNNPILTTLDFMTSQAYGLGIPLASFNLTQLSAMANIADVVVNGRTTFECNMVIQTDQALESNLKALMSSFRGYPRVVNGLIEFGSEIDVASHTLKITDADVMYPALVITPQRDTRYNSSSVRYTDLNEDNEVEVAIYEDAAAITADGRRISKDLKLRTSNTRDRALDLGRYQVITSRNATVLTIQMASLRALEYQVNDTVLVSLSEYGMVDQLYRVTDWEMDKDSSIVNIKLQQHTPSAYQLVVHPTAYTQPALVLPDQFNVDAPTALTATSESTFNSNGDHVGSFRLQWIPPPNSLVNQMQTQMKRNLASEWFDMGLVNGGEIITPPVDDVGTWDVRVKAINVQNSESDWTTLTNQTFIPALDNGIPLPPVTGLSLQGGGIVFTGRSPSFFWTAANWAGASVSPGTGNVGDSSAVMYLVEVFNSLSQQIYGEAISAISYEFTDEKNSQGVLTQSGGTTAQMTRQLEIRVRAKDKFGRLSSPAAILTVTNPPPDQSQLVWSVTPGHQRLTVNISTMPLDNDLVNVQVHMSTAAFFIPSASTFVGSIDKTLRQLPIDFYTDGTPLVNTTAYHVRLIPVDEFGVDLTNYTSIISASPLLDGSIDQDLNAFQNITLSPNGNGFRAPGFQVMTDPFNNTGVPGFFCGNATTEKYIEFSEPTLGQAALKLGRDTQFRGADSYNNDAIYDNWLISPGSLATNASPGTGTIVLTAGTMIMTNGVDDADWTTAQRSASSLVTDLTFQKPRSIRSTVRFDVFPAGTESRFWFITGTLLDPLAETGQYFGFVVRDLNLHAVMRDGVTTTTSAVLGTVVAAGVDEFEMQSNIVAGTIEFYRNGTLIHTFNEDTSTWTDSGPHVLWAYQLYHAGSTGAQAVRFSQAKFLQEE